MTPREHHQTCKVIDRLEEEATDMRIMVDNAERRIRLINDQISALQSQRQRCRDDMARLGSRQDNARHAAEMLSAELEGEGDPRWRSSCPDAAKAEEQARAAIEKQEHAELKGDLGLRAETTTKEMRDA